MKEYEAESGKGQDGERNKKIAVLFGGCSPEYGVSLQSAQAVIDHMDRKKYEPVPIGITHRGEWFYYTGDTERIADDSWCRGKECVPVTVSLNHGEHSLLLLRGAGAGCTGKVNNIKDSEHTGDRVYMQSMQRGESAEDAESAECTGNAAYLGSVERMEIDAVFPVLHGRNGEDGTVQGLFELAGIPVAGCGVLSSALCMDKDRAHRLVSEAGVRVPDSYVCGRDTDLKIIFQQAEKIGYPLFVKPVKAGSSYGITKVSGEGGLQRAVELAFAYDEKMIMEECISGFEVGCAVLGTEKLTVGEVDEIELAEGFFDFTEKYTLKTSAIHVPARIPEDDAERIRETAKVIYRALDCRHFARVDMFFTKEGEIVFNEVNTIPGFTAHSRFPNMMKAAGVSFEEIISAVLEEAL